MKKKVFVGIVTNTERKGYCREALIQNIGLQQGNGQEYEMAIFLIDNAKKDCQHLYPEWIQYAHKPIPEGDHSIREVLAEQRNLLRKQFLQMPEFDYFFSWESDVILPKATIKQLIRDIENIERWTHNGYKYEKINVGVVTAVNIHHKGEDSNLPIAITNIDSPRDELHRNVNWDDMYNGLTLSNGYIKISGSGVGCSLIKREVLEKVRFRVELHKGAFDDMFFSKDVTMAGYHQVMDCRLIADHRQGGWEGVRK